MDKEIENKKTEDAVNHVFQLFNFALVDDDKKLHKNFDKDEMCLIIANAAIKMIVNQYYHLRADIEQRKLDGVQKFINGLLNDKGEIHKFLRNFDIECIRCKKGIEHEDH